MPFERLYTSSQPMVVTPYDFNLCYSRSAECFLARSRGSDWHNAVYRVFHDGTILEAATVTWNGGMVAVHNGKVGCYEHESGGTWYYEFDQIGMVPLYSSVYGQDIATWGYSTKSVVNDTTGYMYVQYSGVETWETEKFIPLRKINLSTDTLTETLKLAQGSDFYLSSIDLMVSYDLNSLLFFQSSTGKLIVFNYYTGEVVLRGTAEPGVAIAYDIYRKVLAVVDNSYYLKIYTLNNLATGLSNPELMNGGSEVALYGGSRFRVRVTDDQDDPIPDVWVEWMLTNWKGYIDPAYSKTDADGYAYTTYFAPTSVAQLGSETITATAEV